MIHENILGAVGGTPVVKLNRIGGNIPVELFGKCEFLNPGGALKDRIGLRMIEKLEEEGALKPGATIIEPTSGNTGIALAMAAAIRGYKMIVTIAEKVSVEKEMILKALGAEVVRTTGSTDHTSPDSQMGRAAQLSREIPGAVMPNQYANSENVEAHYEGTAAEIWEDFGDTLDAIVIGIGTGGAIMGISRFFREREAKTAIIGVEPYGSILGGNQEVVPYTIEGIGYDWVPDIFDAKVADKIMAIVDRDSYKMARRLIREEGLLVGGSSGTVGHAMVEVAKTLPAGAKVLGIFADGIRNYLSKFPSDDWLSERELLD